MKLKFPTKEEIIEFFEDYGLSTLIVSLSIVLFIVLGNLVIARTVISTATEKKAIEESCNLGTKNLSQKRKFLYRNKLFKIESMNFFDRDGNEDTIEKIYLELLQDEQFYE